MNLNDAFSLFSEVTAMLVDLSPHQKKKPETVNEVSMIEKNSYKKLYFSAREKSKNVTQT